MTDFFAVFGRGGKLNFQPGNTALCRDDGEVDFISWYNVEIDCSNYGL